MKTIREGNVCPTIPIASEGCFWAREDGLKGRDCYNSVITNFRAIRKTAFQVKQKETPGSHLNCRAFCIQLFAVYLLIFAPKKSVAKNNTNPALSAGFVLFVYGGNKRARRASFLRATSQFPPCGGERATISDGGNCGNDAAPHRHSERFEMHSRAEGSTRIVPPRYLPIPALRRGKGDYIGWRELQE